jgi:hypothetical protein
MADPDPLDDLRAQVRATQEAAERLMGSGVPPRGWSAAAEPQDSGPFSEEVQALASLVAALRELLPPELREQLNDLLRQLLLVARALIDWWVSRLDEPVAAAAGASSNGAGGGAGSAAGSPRGEDIPIA